MPQARREKPPVEVVVAGIRYVRAHIDVEHKCPCCGQDEPVWTPTAIIQAAVAWAEWAGHTPRGRDWRSARLREEPPRPVEETVYRVFGAWLPMLRAAGLEPMPTGAPKIWTRERIGDALVEHRARFGVWPKTTDWNSSTDWHPHYQLIYRVFPSWKTALAYAQGRYSQLVLDRDAFVPATLIRQVLEPMDPAELAGIADGADVSPDYLYRIQRGRIRRLRFSFADRIAVALNRPDLLAA